MSVSQKGNSWSGLPRQARLLALIVIGCRIAAGARFDWSSSCLTWPTWTRWATEYILRETFGAVRTWAFIISNCVERLYQGRYSYTTIVINSRFLSICSVAAYFFIKQAFWDYCQLNDWSWLTIGGDFASAFLLRIHRRTAGKRNK